MLKVFECTSCVGTVALIGPKGNVGMAGKTPTDEVVRTRIDASSARLTYAHCNSCTTFICSCRSTIHTHTKPMSFANNQITAHHRLGVIGQRDCSSTKGMPRYLIAASTQLMISRSASCVSRSLCPRRLVDVLQLKAPPRAIPSHNARPTHILKAVMRPQESRLVAISSAAVV